MHHVNVGILQYLIDVAGVRDTDMVVLKREKRVGGFLRHECD